MTGTNKNKSSRHCQLIKVCILLPWVCTIDLMHTICCRWHDMSCTVLNDLQHVSCLLSVVQVSFGKVVAIKAINGGVDCRSGVCCPAKYQCVRSSEWWGSGLAVSDNKITLQSVSCRCEWVQKMCHMHARWDTIICNWCGCEFLDRSPTPAGSITCLSSTIG